MALFMSNAVQLKAVLDRGPSSYNYFALVTLLSISLILQVVIGILLVVMGEEPGPGAGLGGWVGRKVPNASLSHRAFAQSYTSLLLALCTFKCPSNNHTVQAGTLTYLLASHLVASTIPAK